MESTQINILWARYKAGTISSEEWELLRKEWSNPDFEKLIENDFLPLVKSNAYAETWTPAVESDMWKVVSSSTLQKAGASRVVKLPWMRYAAAFVLIVGAATFWYVNKVTQSLNTTNTHTATKGSTQELPPGGNRAVLVLADGSEIVLDSAANGNLATQGGAHVIKLEDGSIAYRLSNGTTSQLLSNTMKTPKGGQYKLMLPDGTTVWLNASSSITYPVQFATDHRTVQISGEVYFEIKPSRAPFVVQTNHQKVEVLGTHFNINSYDDERFITTTLLEGRIRVSQTIQGDNALIDARILQPGQQSIIGYNKESMLIQKANVDKVMAWKNGLFNFTDADLPTVMRQISRWYNVDVVYEGTPPTRTFQGEVQRELNLSEVLDVLQRTGIQLRVEGRKIIVKSE